MINQFTQLAERHPDLQFIPLNSNKVPIVPEWQKTKILHDFSKAQGIGLVCGVISGGVEAIDLDLKYDVTGTLWTRIKAAVFEADPLLLKKLFIQKTRSGGFHLVYRCEEIEENKKLARRFTTPEEKLTNPNEKVKVLIETRGEKGQIAIAPTAGYEIMQGDLNNIPLLTIDERALLMEIMASFNEYITDYVPPTRSHEPRNPKSHGLTPMDDYDDRGDVVQLLIAHGWTFVNERGDKTHLRRSGDTSAKTSGNYDRGLNRFSVFSTSTVFDAEKGYKPSAVFAILECDGDFNEAARRLYEMGYGERRENAANRKADAAIPSKIDPKSPTLNFIAKPEDYRAKLHKIRTGDIVYGATFGLPMLNQHFLLKQGNLIIGNGHDNVGKSLIMWYIDFLSGLYAGWKWIIYSSENSVESFYRQVIEFFWCETIDTMSDERYYAALEWVERHFAVIVSDEDLYNYQDILNMAEAIKRVGIYGDIENIKGLLIDPYNSLKMEGSLGKFNPHEYHYEALSKIKLFGKRQGLTTMVNCHAVTNALRQKDSSGNPLPPEKQDTEGGGKWGAKADEFLTIHRLTQSTDFWHQTQIHVRKVKETITGGRVTPRANPCIIESLPQQVGFIEKNDKGRIINPVLEWHRVNMTMPVDEIEEKYNLKQKTSSTTYNTPPSIAVVPMAPMVIPKADAGIEWGGTSFADDQGELF